MIIIFLALLSVLIAPISSSQVSIEVSHVTLSKSGDSVTIHWSGVDSPSDLDWLGIYSPPDSPARHFIGYVFLSSSTTWRSGSGSVNISLVNLRSSYKFRIFRWTQSEVNPDYQDRDHNPLPGTKHLLAESSEVGFEKGRGPEQIHIALTDKDDEMRVMFVTGDGSENVIKFGLDCDCLVQEVGTTVSRYEKEDMCDAPANHSIGWRDPGYIHDGVITNVGNHDGEVHDTVEFMAIAGKPENNAVVVVVRKVDVGRSLGVIILVIVGAFLGYVLGYISHARRQGWSLVKADSV